MFPFYLSIGMTYEQFWEQDVELVKYYREAWKLNRDVRNQEMWLQGAYIYEAILSAAPMLHAFAKKGTKPIPYRDQPYELYTKHDTKQEQETKEQKSDNKAKAVMEMWMVNINKKFEKKGGEGNGG